MSSSTDIERRRGERIDRALSVRFSVNGAIELQSSTLNFTKKSLAIRTPYPAERGDHVRAKIDTMPPLEGTVVRTWDDGFAIILNSESAAYVGQLHGGWRADDQQSADLTGPTNVTGPHFPMAAAHPCRGRLVSRFGIEGSEQHLLSLLATAPIEASAIRSLWVTVADTRRPAPLLRARARRGILKLMTPLNSWQIRMASHFGLRATVILQSLDEWSATADAGPFDLHVNSFSVLAA